MQLVLSHSVKLLKVDQSERMTGRFILGNYILRVLPRVKKLLKSWEIEARFIPDPVLRTQALDSLRLKAFHCQGGAVYAVPWSLSQQRLLQFIVAYQTLCDYLDNLCDRAGSTDGQAFRQLHQSLLDALDPLSSFQDYYCYYPINDDGGYINKLVKTCQACLKDMPYYAGIREEVINLARLYSDLQVKKHLNLEIRHAELCMWAGEGTGKYDNLLWPEFAAACGSTLALFALLRCAVEQERVGQGDITRIRDAYFPWICGLHILLDYFIDRAEDRTGGDLNFTFYYDSESIMRDRLALFTRQSLLCTENLAQTAFHRTVVHGLLAMYLSDGKVGEQGFKCTAGHLLNTGGAGAWRTYHLCRAVRRFL